MVANKELELLDKSRVNLKITVSEADVKKTYDELVQTYRKTAQINGFRVGKVPASILISRFGDVLKDETVKSIIEKSLDEAFESVEHKPLPYAVPELKDKPDFQMGKDFSFEISYDTFPKVELGSYKGVKIENTEVEIKKDDLEKELDLLRQENAIVVEKKEGVTADKDVVTINYAELDKDGNEIESSRREGFTFTVGSGYNIYKIDSDILGMKKDEEKVLHKDYPEDFDYPAVAGKKIDLKVKVTQLKEKKLPDLDDELAQDINEKYKTLADLKKDIEEKLRKNADDKIRDLKIQKILDAVKENSKVTLPESMIERELEREWRSMIYYYGGKESAVVKQLEMQGGSKASYLASRKPAAEESLKTEIIMEEIIQKEKFEVSGDEIEKEIASGAERQKISVDEARERIKQNKMEETLKSGLQRKKLTDFLLESAVMGKTKKIKYQELVSGKSDEEKDK
jgi:trigger factor